MPHDDVRDIAADYLKAYIAEYELYRAVGDPRADEVAEVLKDLGHPVGESKEKAAPKKAPAKQRAVAHDATEKAVEGDVNPKA